ncbi:MAG: hypothetical protein IPK83_15380, partial [Planctomycetes bacterium]|nr:hypothetical protein [Planctomycetota bacterium]
MSFWMVIFLLTIVVELGLGFLLAYGLISKYALEKNDQAKERRQVRPMTGRLSGPMGLSA